VRQFHLGYKLYFSELNKKKQKHLEFFEDQLNTGKLYESSTSEHGGSFRIETQKRKQIGSFSL